MKHKIILFLLLGACTLANASGLTEFKSSEPNKGISFYVLRVIYPEEEAKGVSLKADNKTDSSYLVQSYIRPVDAKTGDVDINIDDGIVMPFIVTPPLARLESGQGLDLRIRRNGQPLPDDRESVYFISMKALPSLNEKDIDKNKMVMTVVTNIKVFYRPAGLAKRAVADVANKLKFRQQGSTLIASNPTPYWLTFSMLKVGDKALDKSDLRIMVPPLGEQSYSLSSDSKGDISWQLIDEDGWNTPIEKQAAA